jgi:predicted peptidase
MGDTRGAGISRRKLLKTAGLTTGAAVTGLLALDAAPLVAADSPGPLETGFINGKVEANGKSLLYDVYVPRDYSPDKSWPVILYLHGDQAQGHDGFRQVFFYGIGPQLWKQPQRFPCMVLMPQHPLQPGWSGSWNDLALRALEEVVEKYGGDRTRLYLTGVSLGGTGTWQMASDHPDLFAAAMPIASTGVSLKLAPALKALPLWVFHGGRDGVASPQSDRAMVHAIQAEGNPNIQYTEYPMLDHNVWDVTYGNPDVIQWLLAQKR